MLSRTLDSPILFLKIEMDFEKEISRLMLRTAPRRTEKTVGYQLI